MSDLSQPHLALSLPAAGAEPPPAERSGFKPMRWPTPPFAAYPQPQRQSQALLCEVEGVNGAVSCGSLTAFSADSGVAAIRVPPARASMPLRFSQFRKLSLMDPLRPVLPPPAEEPHADLLAHRPVVDFRIHWAAGGHWNGRTVGHVEAAEGLYLFTPLDDAGAVQRVFVPRSALAHVDFGPRIGTVVVEEHLATEQQVEQVAEHQQALRNRKLGDILLAKHVVSPEQLLEAIEQQARMPMVRIGEALLGLGLITQAQLADALEQQKADRSVPLGELLVRDGMVTRQDLQTALARKMGYPAVDVANFPAEAEAVRRLPYATARKLNTLPLLLRGSRLIVALEDPTLRKVIEELEFVSQAKVVPALATAAQIAAALPGLYERFGADVGSGRGEPGGYADDGIDASKLAESMELQGGERDDDEAQIEQSDNSLVRLINTMIADAHNQGVSDIHIETHPGRERLRIRFRRDGLLKPYLELPHTYRSALVARIKIMCDLDISERRKPQDGKINFAKYSPQHRLELRVATIPTNNGLEDVVLRLLAHARPLPMDQLGLAPENLERLKQAVERPYGMVLCVGPTGSGKTTTLHSALGHINKPERKIWTAEDPVEITQAGLRQVQVNPKIEWTFAKALRAFLRADPDVIMVGEIRDQETAQMAIEASLTGHLVLSTLHTNSAAETVTRLLDMGMDPFNFGDSLLAVLAQRLVRRLCAKCATPREASAAEIDELASDYLNAFVEDTHKPGRDALVGRWQQRFGRDGRLVLHDSVGCPQCEGSGFRGRAALHEMFLTSRDLRRLIQTGGRVEQLQATAMAEGMRTLRQDGIEKVLAGTTTIGEVRAMSNV